MPPTLLPGPETSLQNVDNNIRGMDANVYELEPSASPLVSLSDAMGSSESDNPKCEWLEDESLPRVTTSSGAASGATTVPVAADIFRAGDVVRFSGLGFGFLVQSTTAGNITGVVLGTAATIPASSEVYLVASAQPEGDTLRAIVTTQLVTQFNYDEIIRTPFGMTTTEQGTNHYGGDERARLRKKFGIEHARAIENSAFFGVRGINGSTRVAGGLLQYISTFVTADTGGLTSSDLATHLQKAFRYGSERKTAFCSPAAVAAIESFALSNLRVVNSVGEKYGIVMKQYVSGQGVIDIIMHRDWYDSAVFKGYMFIVDMEAVKLRPLRNVGSTRLLPNRQANDYDGVKDEYRSETCLQVIHERRHSLITGIT